MQPLARQIEAQLKTAGREALRAAAEQVLDRAIADVPVGDADVDPDPARALAKSGRIVEDGEGFVIIFDGPYAAKQHEDQALKHPRGGRSKYLESNLLAIVPGLEGVVASEVTAAMKRDPSSRRRTTNAIVQKASR